ncbi:tetratricopeptide repeat protein [bacterium]|nr:tetratricopeptide repeat protein [bacterium]
MKIVNRHVIGFVLFEWIVLSCFFWVEVTNQFVLSAIFAQDEKPQDTGDPIQLQDLLPAQLNQILFSGDQGKILAQTHFSMGLLAQLDHDYQGALTEFKKAQSYDPSSSRILTKIGALELKFGEVDNGIAHLKEAVRLDNEHYEPHLLLARYFDRQEQIEEAIAEYDIVMGLAPQDIDPYIEYGQLLDREKMVQKAIEIYRRAADINPDISALWNKLGLLYSHLNDLKNAEQCLKNAIAIDDTSVQSHLALAVVYYLSNDYNAAIKHFEICVRLNPIKKNIYVQLAELYAKVGRYEDAIKTYELLTKFDPDDQYNYINAAYLLLKLNEVDRTCTLLEEAQELFPQSVEILFLLGLTYSEQGKIDEAITVFHTALDNGGKADMMNYYLGALYERKKQLDRAEECFRAAIAFNPQYSDAYNYLAYMFAENGIKLDEAMKLINSALELDAENGAYLDTKGWIYYKQEMYEEAWVWLGKAIKVLPDDPVIRDHLGDALFKLNRREEAIGEWKKSFTLDPSKNDVREKLQAQNISVDGLLESENEQPLN